MSRTVLTLLVRRELGRARSVSPLALGLAIALNASGCLDEVDVPPCARSGTCANSGAGGQTAEAGGPAAGEPRSGAPSQLAGRGGANSEPEGGSSGDAEGGAEAGADAGGAGGALPTCDSCVLGPGALDAPCAGRNYRATLEIAGGNPPFSWQLSPNLEGWSVTPVPHAPDQAVLHGEKVGPGETTLTVQ